MNFEDFPLSPELKDGIHSMGFRTATPVQQQAIPMVLEGKDLMACAQTGTGKTGAYLIPLLEQMARTEEHYIKCLVLVPTRELALQIDQQVEGLAYFSHVRSIPIYGGSAGGVWDQQKRAIDQGVDILIATPGRLMQHMNMGYLKFDRLQHLVLDEADKMLDMGFVDDIKKIERQLPKERQTLMFSATMPSKIKELANTILNNPEYISLAVSKPAEKIDQRAYYASDHQKLGLLQEVIKNETIGSMIMFVARKSNVDKVERALQKLGFDARGFHSDKEQEEREKILRAFKGKAFPILIATDIMSRGIDIENVTHIVNYDVPSEPEDYVHRIGRTARAEKDGIAISFINEEHFGRWARIERLIEREIPKLPLPAGLGEAPMPGKSAGRGEDRGKGGPRKPGGGRNAGGRKDNSRREGPRKPAEAADQNSRPVRPAVDRRPLERREPAAAEGETPVNATSGESTTGQPGNKSRNHGRKHSTDNKKTTDSTGETTPAAE